MGFRGKGWDAHKKWLEGARKAKPVRVTPTRAREIIKQAQKRAGWMPYSDTIDRLISQGEHRWIHDRWMANPDGRSSFTSTLEHIARGRK